MPRRRQASRRISSEVKEAALADIVAHPRHLPGDPASFSGSGAIRASSTAMASSRASSIPLRGRGYHQYDVPRRRPARPKLRATPDRRPHGQCRRRLAPPVREHPVEADPQDHGFHPRLRPRRLVRADCGANVASGLFVEGLYDFDNLFGVDYHLRNGVSTPASPR